MRMQFLLVSALLLAAGAAQAQVQLITKEEAGLPKSATQIASRGVTRGPGIKVVSPDPAAKLNGPVDLKIAFEPRGGAKIDPSSVTLTYLKTPAVDLTSRVKAGIKAEGIDVAKASMPPGEHPLRVTVKDDEGRQASYNFSLTVGN